MKKLNEFTETEKRIMRSGKDMKFASGESCDTLTMCDINPELIKKRDKETVNRLLGAMEKSCETSK